MFYIILIFHILIFIEVYLLKKKRMPKKSFILGVLNGILTILNLIKYQKTIAINISSLVYMQKELLAHPIKNLLWIILNILFLIFTYDCIKKSFQKKVQNKHLKNAIYTLGMIIFLHFIFLIFSKSQSTLLLFFILLTFYKLLKKYKIKKENRILISIFLLILVTFTMYGTTIGAARLQILLNGYIKDSINIGLEEQKNLEEKNTITYSPVKDIELKNGLIQNITVKKYGLIKIGKIGTVKK